MMFFEGCYSYIIISHTLYLLLKLFTVVTFIWFQDTLFLPIKFKYGNTFRIVLKKWSKISELLRIND